MLADEGERLQLLDRLVEDPLGTQLLRRFGGGRRTFVVAGRQAVGELAGRPEAVGDIGSGQVGDGAQCREAETGEQADQLGVDLARLVQPGDGLSGEKGPRRAGAITIVWLGVAAASRAATAEANRPSAMPMPSPAGRPPMARSIVATRCSPRRTSPPK